MIDWPPVYRLPSRARLGLWLDYDVVLHGKFLTPQQRRRYKLRLQGKPEIEWDADVWKKTGKKESPDLPQERLLVK